MTYFYPSPRPSRQYGSRPSLTCQEAVKIDETARWTVPATLSNPDVSISPSNAELTGVHKQTWTDQDLDSAKLQIKEMEILDCNWDSYGSPPISQDAIAAALEAITDWNLPPRPMISPSPEGGVVFEWRTPTGDFTLEIIDRANVETIYHLPNCQAWAGRSQDMPLDIWQVFEKLWVE